jgi:hypothetical protein
MSYYNNFNNLNLLNVHGANPILDNTVIENNRYQIQNYSFKNLGKNSNPPEYWRRYWLLRTDQPTLQDYYNAINFKNTYYNNYNDPNEY